MTPEDMSEVDTTSNTFSSLPEHSTVMFEEHTKMVEGSVNITMQAVMRTFFLWCGLLFAQLLHHSGKEDLSFAVVHSFIFAYAYIFAGVFII